MIRFLLVAAAATFSFSTVRLEAQTAPRGSSAGLDLAGMDRSVAPGDDFFA